MAGFWKVFSNETLIGRRNCSIATLGSIAAVFTTYKLFGGKKVREIF